MNDTGNYWLTFIIYTTLVVSALWLSSSHSVYDRCVTHKETKDPDSEHAPVELNITDTTSVNRIHVSRGRACFVRNGKIPALRPL